jgi:alanine dehydrogenase
VSKTAEAATNDEDLEEEIPEENDLTALTLGSHPMSATLIKLRGQLEGKKSTFLVDSGADTGGTVELMRTT